MFECGIDNLVARKRVGDEVSVIFELEWVIADEQKSLFVIELMHRLGISLQGRDWARYQSASLWMGER